VSRPLRLGVDTYSLRWQGFSAFDFVDYAAEHGLDNVHFSSRANFDSLEPDHLRTLKQHADARSVALEMGMGSFDRFASTFHPEYGTAEQQLTEMLRAAEVVGSRWVRCFLGVQADRCGPMPWAQHLEETRRVIRAVAPLARDLGIKLAVENHGDGDFLARELRCLVEEIGFDVVGVCLDTGAPAYAAEDPLLAAEVLAPYVLTSHVRDTRVWSTPDGAMAQWVPLGQGNVDLAGIVGVLRERSPDPPIDLEIVTGRDPRALPYLDPTSDFWTAFPDTPARDFARFVALAGRGTPEPLDQLIGPRDLEGLAVDQATALRDQQRRHFEESVCYAREVLGLGSRR
jgi:sugar phosphate isomerase/epimerase